MAKGKSDSTSARTAEDVHGDGVLLERRAKKGEGRGGRSYGARQQRRPLSLEAFQEAVARHCRRFQKDGWDFSITSLTILQYRAVNEPVLDSLDKAVVSVLFQHLRAEDQICIVEPAHYLVLTPSTKFEEASCAMQRVAEKISELKIRTGSDSFSPSTFVQIVSAESGAIKSGGAHGHPLDLQKLLFQVGCSLDASGILKFVERGDGHREPLFKGGFEAWLSRYQGKNDKLLSALHERDRDFHVIQLQDKWNDDAAVEFRLLGLRDVEAATVDGAHAGNLLKRLRVLQNFDHPGVVPLSDFYITHDGKLILVNTIPEGVELTSASASQLKKVFAAAGDKIVLEWFGQLLAVFIALQAEAPPIVPSSFESLRIFSARDNGRLVVCNYDLHYLANACIARDLSSSQAAKGQDKLVVGLVDFISRMNASSTKTNAALAKFLSSLAADAMASPHKLRAQLKHFLEDGHA